MTKDNLEGLGFTVVPFGQGFKDMSPPTKELMKMTLEDKLAHGGHPVLPRLEISNQIKRNQLKGLTAPLRRSWRWIGRFVIEATQQGLFMTNGDSCYCNAL